MQVLEKLDFNDSTVQHVVLASIPPQDPPAYPAQVCAPCLPLHALIPPIALCIHACTVCIFARGFC